MTYKETIIAKVKAAKTNDELVQIENEIFEHYATEMNQKLEAARQAIDAYKAIACECYDAVSVVRIEENGQIFPVDFSELHKIVDPLYRKRK